MAQVSIIDTTLRDAHQCLWATRMRTSHMTPIAHQMDRVGFSQIDLMGTIQFDVCVRYLQEDPWERVRVMADLCEQTPLRALVRSRNVVSFDVVPDDIIELWTRCLVKNGFRVVGAFDGLNDLDNLAPTLNTAKTEGVRTFGALAYSLSPVHTDEMYRDRAAELVHRFDVDDIMIKDSSGLLTVDRIRTLVPAIREVAPDVGLELHSHCQTALAPLVYLEAVDLGVDALHASVGPLANGPAQPSVQATVRNLTVRNHSLNVDLNLVDDISTYLEGLCEREDLPKGVVSEYDEFHYEHQIPGGMISNLAFQLSQFGIGHRLDAVLKECARIRQDLGWPIMITPFAQLVGTQAVLNVVHGERYRVVPNEVRKYVGGAYGRLLAPVSPEVLERVATGEPQPDAETLAEQSAVDALRERYPSASDEERLLRFMFAGNQVDKMKAAIHERGADASDPGDPLTYLITQLEKDGVRSLDVERGSGSFSLKLS